MSHDQPSQHSGDRRWKRWIAVLFGVFAVGVMALLMTRQSEPSHAGKSLSQWLAVLETGRFEAVDQRPVLNPDAVQAIQAMGDAAVTQLVDNIDSWFAAEMRAEKLAVWPTGIPKRLFGAGLERRSKLGSQSLMALSVLGEAAKSSPPLVLSVQTRHPAQQQILLMAAAGQGMQAIGVISNALRSPEFWTRRAAIEAAAFLSTNGSPLVPMLIAIHSDMQADNTDRNIAARALGRIAHPSNQIAAALRQSLTSTNPVLVGNAALGLMLAGVREPEVANELAVQVRGDDGRLNLFVLLSLTVLETNNTRLVSLLKQHAGMNPKPKQSAEKVFNDVRQTWTNCDGASRNEMYAMLRDLIAMRGTN